MNQHPAPPEIAASPKVVRLYVLCTLDSSLHSSVQALFKRPWYPDTRNVRTWLAYRSHEAESTGIWLHEFEPELGRQPPRLVALIPSERIPRYAIATHLIDTLHRRPLQCAWYCPTMPSLATKGWANIPGCKSLGQGRDDEYLLPTMCPCRALSTGIEFMA